MRRLALLAACAGLACHAGEASPGPAADAPSEALAALHQGPRERAVIEVAGLGEIELELFPEIAPATVASFTKLARQGYYDGTTFHRVMPGFMIQGGCENTRNLDPRDDGEGNPGYNLPDEFSDYPHTRGTVAMANQGFVESGGSQFFIVHQDARHLDGKYAAFGRVVRGMEVVDAITELEIDQYGRYGPRNRPYPRDARVTRVRVLSAATTTTAAAAAS